MVRYPAFIPLAAERRVLARVLGGWAAVAVGPGPPGGWGRSSLWLWALPCGTALALLSPCTVVGGASHPGGPTPAWASGQGTG